VKSPVEQTQLDMQTIEDVLADRGYVNASVVLREDVDLDRLIDATADNRRYMPSMKAINKIDTVPDAERERLRDEYPDAVFISAENKQNLDRLQQRIYDELELMRIYMKEPGKDADKEEPLIVKRGSTIEDVCETLPGDMDETFESARIWGDSADFPEQRVGKDHVLQDADIVEVRTR
jgi:ribosome-interacting GTPase 1